MGMTWVSLISPLGNNTSRRSTSCTTMSFPHLSNALSKCFEWRCGSYIGRGKCHRCSRISSCSLWCSYYSDIRTNGQAGKELREEICRKTIDLVRPSRMFWRSGQSRFDSFSVRFFLREVHCAISTRSLGHRRSRT